MKFEIVTIFPDFFRGPLDYGIVRKSRESSLIEISIHDLRVFTSDKHRTVDDRPFGGGEGMVLKPEPLFQCVESLGIASREQRLLPGAKESVILLSPQGEMFTQQVAQELAGLERMVLICGRYEGVDERVAEGLADREISIGDYDCGYGDTAFARRAGQRSFGDAGKFYGNAEVRHRWSGQHVRLRRIARLSALHAARGVSRNERAGSADGRQPRTDSRMAPPQSAGKDSEEPPGFARRAGDEQGRSQGFGRDQEE